MAGSDGLVILLFIGSVIAGIVWIICLVCICSHIVRKHILLDREQDLVCEINWNVAQHADANEIQALEFERNYVVNTMKYHKRMIILNVINMILLLVIVVAFYASGLQWYQTQYYQSPSQTLNSLGGYGY